MTTTQPSIRAIESSTDLPSISDQGLGAHGRRQIADLFHSNPEIFRMNILPASPIVGPDGGVNTRPNPNSPTEQLYFNSAIPVVRSLYGSAAADALHRFLREGTAGAGTLGQLGDNAASLPINDTRVQRADSLVSLTTPAADTRVQNRDATREVTRETPETRRQAIEGFRDTLMLSGMSPEAAQRLADQAMTRLESKRATLVTSPEEQMRRATRSMQDVLTGTREPLLHEDRERTVLGMASRLTNPERFVNQGHHMTCVPESMMGQLLQSGNPAQVLQQIASVANNGYADITERNGRVRRVTVDPRSITPDAESRRAFSDANFGAGGRRDMAGHIFDALAGQAGADLQAEREGRPRGTYLYMAANADAVGGRNSQTSTGEGFFRRNDNGSYTQIADNPNLGAWAVAHLNRAMGGNEGAVFGHRRLIGQRPSGYPADLTISTFDNITQCGDLLRAYQQRTGQMGQFALNAPDLPGGGHSGHGLHATLGGINADGTFRIDNTWGGRHDLASISADDMDRATNPGRWNQGGGNNRQPDGLTPIGPRGTGRNPNETEDEYRRRRETETAQSRHQDEDERQRQQNRQRQGMINRQRAQTEFAAARADHEYQQALANRSGQPFTRIAPSLDQFVSRYDVT